jgi:hypothetical protein
MTEGRSVIGRKKIVILHLLVQASSMAMPQIDLFDVACFLTWIHGFSPRAVLREFLVD